MNRAVVGFGVLLASVLGCDSAGSDAQPQSDLPGGLSDEMPEDLPAGECRAGETDAEDCASGSSSTGDLGSTSGQAGAVAESECTTTDECEGAGACAAAWQGGARTTFSCRFACIPTLNEDAWCRDDASCCDTDAVCTGRGYCVVRESGEDSDGFDNVGSSPKLSDEMPEDLPAGGATPDGVLLGGAKDLP